MRPTGARFASGSPRSPAGTTQSPTSRSSSPRRVPRARSLGHQSSPGARLRACRRPWGARRASSRCLGRARGGARPHWLTGDPVRDAAGARAGPYLSVDDTGRLSLRTSSIHRPSFEDAHRLGAGRFSDPETLFWDEDPLYDTDPLFDVVDLLLPLYLAATAISSGAYDRLLQLRGGTKRCRNNWRLEIEERIAFPTPRGGPGPVGFPGRIPARIPLAGPRPEPSMARIWGRNLARETVGLIAWSSRS